MEINNSLLGKRLKEIEPGYSDWDDSEIENQIEEIYKCGYTWDNEHSIFYNQEIDMYLKVQGLNSFKPDDISEFYERVWSKERPRTGKEDSRAKWGCFGYIVVGTTLYLLIKFDVLNLSKWYIAVAVGVFSLWFIIFIAKFFKED